MANFKAPCEWCKFGQVFNGQLGHLYKLGDWKTTLLASELQTPKGTQYTGGWNFFVPDFNKLPYSLCSPDQSGINVTPLSLFIDSSIHRTLWRTNKSSISILIVPILKGSFYCRNSPTSCILNSLTYFLFLILKIDYWIHPPHSTI